MIAVAETATELGTATVLDGYIRVSRRGGREGERFISPEEQKKAIEGWARRNGARIGKWHTDMSRSGGTMERKGLRAAILRVEKKQTGGIVVARLDRFARNTAGGMAAIERIHGLGGRVVSVAENVDPATATGRMYLGIILVIAEWQRATAGESFEIAIRNAAERGLFATRTTYGFMKGENDRIVRNPETAPIAAEIVEMRAAGIGWAKICSVLVKRGIPTPTGRKQWAKSSVVAIVRSESLLGVWNGPYDIRIEGAWEAIVDRETWERANAITGTRDDARGYTDRTYAGLARCAECRRPLTRVVNNTRFVSYGCAVPGCKAVSIGADVLDSYVNGLVDARLAKWRLRAERDDDGTVEQLVKARNRTTKEFAAWRDDTEMRELIGEQDYRAGLRARALKRDEAEEALAVARAERQTGIELPEETTVTLADLPWEDRRRVVEAAVHAVWVRKSAIRGPGARKRAGERLLIEFVDERKVHELPSTSVRRAELAAVAW